MRQNQNIFLFKRSRCWKGQYVFGKFYSPLTRFGPYAKPQWAHKPSWLVT